jgi:hypothetical protein
MPLDLPRDATIAIVGDGLGSALVYATAAYLGFPPGSVTVYGPSARPYAGYGQLAGALGQRVFRSDAEAHFLPADWPTFAQLDAWARRSPAPLARSLRGRYNPGVPDVMAELAAVTSRVGWDDNRYPRRVGWIERVDGDPDHFVLYDEAAGFAGRARHVVLALGHGPLAFPPALAAARADPALADRIVQAYEPKRYAAGGAYVVVGAGIAAVNEWVAALDAGAAVVSLQRNPLPDEDDLSTARCLLGTRGAETLQGVPLDRRLDLLAALVEGGTPATRTWGRTMREARATGRFEQLVGEIERAMPGPAGVRLGLRSAHGPVPETLDVTGVVAATGFSRSALAVPLLRRLIDTYDLPIQEGRLMLRPDCGVPGLDRPRSRLAVMGGHAHPVVPNGDTVAGLRFVAKRFVTDVARAEGLKRRSVPSRLRLQLSLAGAAAGAIRGVRAGEGPA